ncbi:Helicase [Pasteurella testudinis DSM 23072]|uniref:Helicase n=1 Tax=Pasteurella testudinis DSM 23072 TaxID=1122938 RepID=A0A1W1UJX2_9PAST|nr:DEAD/DEAH box helicase [Pasteurella testudinis]SMB81425.1 Helicase [Pasteurella testudinis DSM 23072]SUB51403.1 conjugal transfer relaxase TraA [Pasteurella testudinis]
MEVIVSILVVLVVLAIIFAHSHISNQEKAQEGEDPNREREKYYTELKTLREEYEQLKEKIKKLDANNPELLTNSARKIPCRVISRNKKRLLNTKLSSPNASQVYVSDLSPLIPDEEDPATSQDTPLDGHNNEFKEALEKIVYGNNNLFVTGKAGTGKTTLLKTAKNAMDIIGKKSVVLSPTGVAAINANGSTIHSFFKLIFGPFLPDDHRLKYPLIHKTARVDESKIKLIQELDAIIIDEVSMVRSDIMDAVDTILRYYRKKPHELFGGVQMIFIGDLYQLPPVVDRTWRTVCSTAYTGEYFFYSGAVNRLEYDVIELEKVYRQQNDQEFTKMLNRLRVNKPTIQDYTTLTRKYSSEHRLLPPDGCITLCTHASTARNINSKRLESIKNKLYTFQAFIYGEYPHDGGYPADECIELKLGAQVMFTKNDRNRCYVNGTMGRVTDLSDHHIIVTTDRGISIDVPKERWDNIDYSIKDGEVVEDVIGYYEQYPLRLAFAITIHKSQGLTFSQIAVDAKDAFVPGQVYVALSRCRTLDGIIIKTPISPETIRTDNRVDVYINKQRALTSIKRKQSSIIRSVTQSTINPIAPRYMQ